jgi:hypothetical protein
MPPEAVIGLFGMFASILGGMLILGPIGRAFADRLRGKAAPAPMVQEQLDEVLARLEEMQHQLGEVVERQEFTERLLAQVRERGQLGAGDGGT